jgi:hypothetical protein
VSWSGNWSVLVHWSRCTSVAIRSWKKANSTTTSIGMCVVLNAYHTQPVVLIVASSPPSLLPLLVVFCQARYRSRRLASCLPHCQRVVCLAKCQRLVASKRQHLSSVRIIKTHTHTHTHTHTLPSIAMHDKTTEVLLLLLYHLAESQCSCHLIDCSFLDQIFITSMLWFVAGTAHSRY